MSEASQVNPSDQHEDDSASKPAESESSKENPSKQVTHSEMTPSPAKPVSLTSNEIVQETKTQSLSPDAIRAQTEIEVASKEQGEGVQETNNPIIPAKMAPPIPVEPEQSKPDEVIPEKNDQSTSPEMAQTPPAVEPVALKPGEIAQLTEKKIPSPAPAQVPFAVVPTSPSHKPHKITLEAIASERPLQTHQQRTASDGVQSVDGISRESKTEHLVPQNANSAHVVQSAQITQSSPTEHIAAQHEETKSAENDTTTTHPEAKEPQHGEGKDGEHHEPETPENEKEGEEDEDEDDETALPFIQKRRFTFKGMSHPQRFISGLAIGQLLASALLILLTLIPPYLLFHIQIQTTDATIDIPAVAFIAAVIFNILAWSFLLSGALHGHILMRLLVLGVFSCVLCVLVLSSPYGIMTVASIVLLAILWIWGLVVWLIERSAAREGKKQEQQTASSRHGQLSTQPQQDVLIRLDWGLYLPTFLPVLGLLILYNVMYLAYFAMSGFDLSQTLQLFYEVVETYLRSQTFLLIPVLFLASSDFAELGEAIARSGGALIGKFRTRAPWLLALVTALLSLLIIGFIAPIWKANMGSWLHAFFLQLAVFTGIIVVLAGIVYLTGMQRWPALGVKRSTLHIKTRLLILAMFTIIGGFYVPGIIAVLLNFTQDTVNQLDSFLLILIPLLIALLLAVPFLWRRKQPNIFAVAALFFLVLGTVILGYYLSEIIVTFVPKPRFDFGLSSILLTVTVATLIVLAWLLLTRKITAENTGLLSLLLMLNGSLGFVALMYRVYDLALESSKGVAVLQAALLIIALGWDIFTSGENTNKGGPHSPRHTRLLLFLGYTMLVATVVLYFSSQRTPDGKPLQELFFESEFWVQQGLFFLGVPLVITTFILQVTYWWGSRNLEAGGESASPKSEAEV